LKSAFLPLSLALGIDAALGFVIDMPTPAARAVNALLTR
jgi:hypothetical protein